MKKIYVLLWALLPVWAFGQVVNSDMKGHYNVMTFYMKGDINNATRILTQIPLADEAMPSVRIKGFDLSKKADMDITISWYQTGGQFQQAGMSSAGGYLPSVILAQDGNGMVNIYLEDYSRFVRFEITALGLGMHEKDQWFANWEVADEPVSGSEVTPVPGLNRFNAVEATEIYSEKLSANDINTYNLNVYNNTTTRGINVIGGGILSNFNSARPYGMYFSRHNSYFSQNAYYTGKVWKSYATGTEYNSAVLMQSGAGYEKRAFILSVDNAIAAPNEDLQFQTIFNVTLDGKLGVGTATDAPSANIHVKGSGNTIMLVEETGSGTATTSYKVKSGSQWDLCNTSGTFAFKIGTTAHATFTSTGNLLLGKTTQTNTAYKLDVNGNIRANKVVVNTTGADFVFEQGYHLMPLTQLSQYIQANKHLPGIAPAQQMQQQGADMGEMQTKLLQKVEELTLYILDLQKQINALKARLNN